MERKGTTGRMGKGKAQQHPAEVYALGAKSSTDKPRAGPSATTSAKVPSLTGDRERKRDGANFVPGLAMKKPKLSSTSSVPILSSRPTIGGSSSSGSVPSSPDAWETVAVDADPSDLVMLVVEANEADEPDKVAGLLCGAVRLLKTQRMKPDPVLVHSLVYLAKIRPSIFMHESVVNALCSILKKESAVAFKSKGNTFTPVLTVSIIMSTYQDVKKWPDLFIKMYLEDAGGERIWVDNELCKHFVDNIVLGLNTKPITVPVTDALTRSEQADEDLVSILKPSVLEAEQIEQPLPTPRFKWNKDAVEDIVIETVKEQLTRKQSTDLVNKNFLKMLTALTGVTEIRVLVASRLEGWLQNPKLMRPAQELLMSVAVNSTAHTMKDVEVIGQLIKMRLKTKSLGQYYLACIKELVTAHPDNLPTVLKHTIYNELSNSRNPNNMAMLSVMFQHDPDRAASYLASIFLELLTNREDYLRPLRALLREMVKMVRGEMRLQTFAQSLMNHEESFHRDVDLLRTFTSVIDLISLCIFLAVMGHAKSEKRDAVQLERMQMTVAHIQCDTVWWLQKSALVMYCPPPHEFNLALRKVLLLEPPDSYCKVDGWPPEQDRSVFLRLTSEVPVLENTLLTVLAVGLKKELPLNPSEAMEVADLLVRRAASMHNPIVSPLHVEKEKVMDLIFNLAAYRPPEKLELPAGYSPPSLAISNLYWKGWVLLLILVAHNPSRLGSLAWEKYPTLRLFMEMCITSHFALPPGFDDLQALAIEKQIILEYESHLAAASKTEITEANSLLLTQTLSLSPCSAARKPPAAILELLSQLNTSLRLGHLLCRCRNPDFLLDIIHRQGSSQSMPWLADLVHNSEGALSHLPVQCLCEFLLSSSPKQEGKYQELLVHLQNILTDPLQPAADTCEVLDYFLRRLSSTSNRHHAINGLKLVLSPVLEEEVMDLDKPEDKVDTTWLTKQLPLLPNFAAARPQIVASLRSASQVENDPELVTAYLCFLAEQVSPSSMADMTDLVSDMASLIVERTTIMSAILPPPYTQPNPALDAFITIFHGYITKAREPLKDAFTWSESQEQILVSWPTGEECTVHILVVHATIILLTFGHQATSKVAEYNHLLDVWLPLDPTQAPRGFLVDTSEEALLIPDWLKLRMIRTHVHRLVQAALTDLDVSQLILFIQSFGIPIASMSKLLTTLDQAILEDQKGVLEAVIDKAYMIQLVEVQHRRGAVGGDMFKRGMGGPLKEELSPGPSRPPLLVPSIYDHKYSHPPTVDPDDFPEAKLRADPELLPDTGVPGTLEALFPYPPQLATNESDRKLFRIVQQTLVEAINSSPEDAGAKGGTFVKELLRYVLRRVTTDDTFVYGLLSKPQFASPMFRLLTAHNPSSVALNIVADSILAHADSFPRAKPLVSIFTQYLTTKAKRQSVQPEAMDLESVTHQVSSAMNNLLVCRDSAAGPCVDKLVSLEPELLGSNVALQMRLLFSVEDRHQVKCRPYLLTLLTHHASWKTLAQCMGLLLRPEAVSKHDPSAVLDFLRALTCNPKLWQGREKHTPKHYSPEDILKLDSHQLECLCDYIVSEGVSCWLDNSESELSVTSPVFAQMSSRIALVRQCLNATDMTSVQSLVKHLLVKSDSAQENKHKVMSHLLLVLLYMKMPALIGHETQITSVVTSHSYLTVGGTSVMDVLSHSLLTAISTTNNSKDWTKKSQDLEVSLRKMAATHPVLLLRQLPLVACSLKGRTDLDWSVFKTRNHLLLFQQFMSLLELLQPVVFGPKYTPSLHSILDCYLEMFLAYSRRDSGAQAIGALVTQFVQFFQAYIKHTIGRAGSYLRSQVNILRDLINDYPPIGNLCIITTTLRGESEILVTPTRVNEVINSQWDVKVAALQQEDEDQLQILMYMDYTSSKRPSLLVSVMRDLLPLMRDPSQQVRAVVHQLLAKCLRYQPSLAVKAVPFYLSCLDPQTPEILVSALDKLPEVILCSQEQALSLLERLFELEVYHDISTFPCISKSIAMLNLQSAC